MSLTQNEMIIIVLAVVGLAFSLFAYLTNRQWAGVVKEIVGPLIARADMALVPYGSQLATAHQVAEAATGLIDQNSDWIIQQLATLTGKPPDVISAKLLDFFGTLEDLTDGEPEVPDPTTQETGEPGGAVR